jgi:hypothetical protein
MVEDVKNIIQVVEDSFGMSFKEDIKNEETIKKWILENDILETYDSIQEYISEREFLYIDCDFVGDNKIYVYLGTACGNPTGYLVFEIDLENWSYDFVKEYYNYAGLGYYRDWDKSECEKNYNISDILLL